MDELLGRVRRYAQRYGLFQAGEIVVVGVSGGPDSLCLLHLLRRLAPELRLWLHVAHLNHGLRGSESDADAAYVAELADCWGLPCTVGRADVAALAEAGRLSIEEAARQARYRFLAEVAEAGGAHTIAVGHNADDQAETVLMHLLRGSGVAGLRGMLPRTPLQDYRGLVDTGTRGHGDPGTAFPGVTLVRPLLAIARADIETYCAAHNLVPRYDVSNEDTTFFRNRLRHELLPVLATYNPAIRQVLAHTAEVLTADYDILHGELEKTWRNVILGGSESQPVLHGQESAGVTGPGCGAVQFSLTVWRGLPLGLQRAMIREAIHRLRRSLRNINWEHVERAVWLAREGGTGQAATLAAGLELQIGYDTLRIAAEGAPWQADVPQVGESLPLRAPGVTEIGGGWQAHVARLRREELPADFAAHTDSWAACLDAGAVGEVLTLRPRQPGDRFQPQGLGGHSTALTGFMINAKIVRAARAGWPLLIGQGGIAWVCGLRLDQRAVIRPETVEIWHVRFARR